MHIGDAMSPDRKFHATRRYVTLHGTRYQRYTYGRKSFATPGEGPHDRVHGSYGRLLFDKRWIQKRAQVIERDQQRCRNCGSMDKLQVHHRQYHFIRELQLFKAPWDYAMHLMVTLCDNCHSRGHARFKVPTIYL